MLRQVTLCTALIALAMASSSLAQTPEKLDHVPVRPAIETPREQIDGAARFRRLTSGSAEFKSSATRSMEVLLTEIVTWLSTNFDLPGIHDLPHVELVPATRMVSLRYKGLLPDQWRENNVNDPAARADFQREVVAVYNDSTKTIFLPESWTGSTPAEQSMLVHEMVHHLQNLGKFKYECPQAREKLAYEAQNDWLKLYRLELEKEFEIDMFTVLISAACMN
jgi:hypothetical protein